MNEEDNLAQPADAEPSPEKASTKEAKSSVNQKSSEEELGEAVMGTAASAKNASNMKLIAEIAEKDAVITELTNDLQRTRADFENFRRQVELQKTQYGNSVKAATVKKVLPLIDDIDRAIVAHPTELSPLAKNLEKTLETVGLTKIPADADTEFDPALHDAITVEGNGDTETIAEALRTGYYYESEVLRPTLVRVIKK